MKKLLIHIPSYNRYDLLVGQLQVLSTSIENDNIKNVRIVVSDNASTDKRYLDLPNQYQQDYIAIKRNCSNIGGIGNMIRGFELDDWDYIWSLSDDDTVKPDALRVIVPELNEGKYDFFYLKCNIKGDERVYGGEVINSQKDYFKKFALFSMMGLMSANIYSSKIKKYIEYMYLYGYTLFPHIAAKFKLMETENFSLKCIGGNLVEWRPNNISFDHIYEMALMNILFLTELVKNKKNSKILINTHIKDLGDTHYFPFAFKSPYNIKKALTQVGICVLVKAVILYIKMQFRMAMYYRYKAVKTFLKFHRGTDAEL